MTPRYPEHNCGPAKYGAWSIRVNNFWRLKTINKRVPMEQHIVRTLEVFTTGIFAKYRILNVIR